MAELLTTENAIALLTLSVLEIVLGIDNIVFLAIITERVEAAKRSFARRVGLALALIMRVALLFGLSWIIQLTRPLFSVLEHPFSGRDLVLLLGGLFLLGKATFEIHGTVEHDHGPGAGGTAKAGMAMVLVQIVLLDAVFSLDSVITAVGMAKSLTVMVTAVIIAIITMMLFANTISDFVLRHPTVKMLALSFLILISVVLIADGLGTHIEKGYIYFAMAFSILVETLNMRMRRKKLRVSGP